MLKKFVTIKNVGRFVDCSAKGDVEFQKATLLCGENGRGKTTLCEILRSLQTGNGEYIDGRQTLGGMDKPEVVIRLDISTTAYRNGTWSASYSDIAIFDSTFVYENVFAGHYVDHEHKKNLYRVIVGAQGVTLARKVDELDSDIRDANREITLRETEVNSLLPDGLARDMFLALPPDDQIDEKIRTKETEITALERANDVAAKSLLETITLSSLPNNFNQLLAKELEDISKDAEVLVREHVNVHTGRQGEMWLSQGLDYVTNGVCPFCGQGIDGNTLLQAYRDYFAESYRALKKEIAALQSTVDKLLGETPLLAIQKAIGTNNSLCEFWKQFLVVDAPQLSFDKDVQAPLNTLRAAAQACIKQKMASPLEPFTPGADFTAALSKFEVTRMAVETYNTSVDAANQLITAQKGATQSGDLVKAKRQLQFLRALKQRHESKGAQMCQRYSDALKAKRVLENEKDISKTQLDTYTNSIFPTYEERINKILDICGTGFQISETRRRYVGGTPSSSYQIIINGMRVELGDSSTPLKEASFKNTVSAGDKSTLALAFFITQLEQDLELSKKVVVFDDPFTSLDRSRRKCTQQLICKIAQSAKQVIVLSHDSSFLRLIWDAMPSGNVKALQFSRMGQQTVITEWDIEDDTKGDYFQNYCILATYYHDGDGERRHVAQTIRVVLEGYLRIKLPRAFLENEWLGDFIKKIRNADPADQLSAAQSILSEVEAINDYCKNYHHDQNPGCDTEPIDDAELTAYAKRTLDLIGAF